METKKCYNCKMFKPFNEFNKDFMGKYGLSSKCRACADIIVKNYYEKNKAKIHQRFLTTVICPECLCPYKKSNKTNHIKTIKHNTIKNELNQINYL